jgi:beta-glucosidase
VEGAVDEGGRGPSIWDTFCRVPGAIRGGDTGDVACDQYHRYEDDAALMAELGLNAYRFSVAWPRIQPDGTGPPNPEGLDHYRRLVDALNRLGIAPVLTLYHWDLPQALEDAGGWPNRDTAERFAEYAGIVAGALAGEVGTWLTLNEPWVSAWLGYGTGGHAPGRRDDRLALEASHHLLLAHGLALETLADAGEVGIAINPQPAVAATASEADVAVARLADRHMIGLFLDPLFGRGYPAELVEHYRDVSDFGFVRDGDLETIARPFETLGVNYYRVHTVAAVPPTGRKADPLPGGIGAWSFAPDGAPVTSLGWPIDASGLTDLLVRLHREYAPNRIVVTENGAAFDDVVDGEGRVRDPDRIAYLKAHLAAARDAIAQGVPLDGYLVWSLLDNFEWAQGYSARFGVVHVEFQTQQRTPKDSAAWLSHAVRGAFAG